MLKAATDHKKEYGIMKKSLCLSLCVAACITGFAADAFLRVDVDGIAARNVLTPASGETMSLSRSWQNAKENLKYTLRASTVEKLSGDWKTVQFSFTPQATGMLKVRLGGLWTKEEKERAWVLIGRIEQDGALIENGDFRKSVPAGKNRPAPAGVTLAKNAKFLPVGGRDGASALLVNCDNNAIISVSVEAGMPCTLKFEVKAAPEN